MTSPKRALAETLAMYALMISYAVSTTVIGSILPKLLEDFRLPLADGGIFIAVLNTGCLGGILISGVLVDRYGKRGLIAVSHACFLAALLAVSASHSLRAYLCLLFLAGLCSKFMDAALNAGVSQLHSGKKKGFFLNLLHCCYATGSFFGPLFVGALVGRGYQWRSAYAVIGCASAIFFVAYAVVAWRGRGDGMMRPSPVHAQATWRTVLKPRMVFLCLMLFFYCGHEIGLNNWLPTCMMRMAGSDELTAASGVSAFWLGLIASRIACSVLTQRVYERKLLIYGCAFGSAFLLLGVAAGGQALLLAGSAGAGLFAGGTIPMIMTLGFSWNPGAQGKAAMALFIAVTAGSVVFPWIMGVVADVVGLKAAMVLNGLLLVTVVFFAICLPVRAQNNVGEAGNGCQEWREIV